MISRVRTITHAGRDRLARAMSAERFRQWEERGGPGSVVRWITSNRGVVSVVVCLVMAGAMAVTFRALPFAVVLGILLIGAGVYAWLSVEHRVQHDWFSQQGGSSPHGDADQT